MDERVFLVGCILQGMATRNNIYFGMAEDALAVADAVIVQMDEKPISELARAVHESQADYKTS